MHLFGGLLRGSGSGGGSSGFSGDIPMAKPTPGPGQTPGIHVKGEARPGGPPIYTGIGDPGSAIISALKESMGNMAAPAITRVRSLTAQGNVKGLHELANRYGINIGGGGGGAPAPMGPPGTTAVPNPGMPGNPAPAGTTLNTMPDGTQFSAAPMTQTIDPSVVMSLANSLL